MTSTRFTKEVRQEIVREFAVRHNGHFNPVLFRDEVRSVGHAHRAYAWFEWDAATAADAFQIEQARNFARDLRVVFRVEEITGQHSVRVRQAEMPMVISPLETRSKGGGYVLVDPDEPEHIQEHCAQAARALGQWLGRYRAAIVHAGVKIPAIDAMIGQLEGSAGRRAA